MLPSEKAFPLTAMEVATEVKSVEGVRTRSGGDGGDGGGDGDGASPEHNGL